MFPANFYADADGNAPLMLGGTLGVKSFNLTFATTAATRAFTLPAGAKIVAWGLVVPTVFNAGSSNTLSVGGSTSATQYLSAAAVLGTAGQVYSTAWVTTNSFATLTSAENVTVTYAQSGGAATAGSAWLYCLYAVD